MTQLQRPAQIIGVDLGKKNSCSVVGLDATDRVALRRRVRRDGLVGLAAKLPGCIVATKACCGAHHLGRQLEAQRHEVRLMSPEYVRPYVKAQKNDDRDAEAIAEAARVAAPICLQEVTATRRVAATYEPGACVRQVAASHDLYPGLLFTWRRQVRVGTLAPAAMPVFLPVRATVAATPVVTDKLASHPTGHIEVELRDGSRVRFDASVSLASLRRVIAALRG